MATTKTEKVRATMVEVGDTVMQKGQMVTVHRGTVMDREVERVLFPRWYKGEVVGYAKQL